ncbi:MAG: CoA-binding protein [Bacteroidota bacterium]
MKEERKYKTLVLGASTNPSRYSHIATLRLAKAGYEVIPLGRKEGRIGDIEIQTEQAPFEEVHTITMYLNPKNQKEMYTYILSLNPKRIIFNPGSENVELASMASEQGIEVLNACTLVLLSTGQYELGKEEMGVLH